MISMNKNKYPENQEEKKDMKKPYAADKCPKKTELQIGKEYHYCACGLSKNQPLCDGSHIGTPFQPKTFVATKETNFLCMCRRSKFLPQCDGSHKLLSF